MAMIEIKKYKDEFGREQIIYYDTDELSQEDYCKFRRLQKSGRRKEALNFISKREI